MKKQIDERKIDLNDLSKQELIDIIISLQSRQGHNKIEICDFTVESMESLVECEQTINRLIEKHKTFAEFRKKKVLLEETMANGIG